MPILQQKPVTPSGRFYLKNKPELSDKRPEKALTKVTIEKKVETPMVVLHLVAVVVVIRGCTARSTFVVPE